MTPELIVNTQMCIHGCTADNILHRVFVCDDNGRGKGFSALDLQSVSFFFDGPTDEAVAEIERFAHAILAACAKARQENGVKAA